MTRRTVKPEAPQGAASAEPATLDLEAILRHIIALAQAAPNMDAGDELLGVGVQLVYAKSGVRLMSIKADLDPRNHELLSAGALVRASSASAPPGAQELLARIDKQILQASLQCLAATKNKTVGH